MQPYNDSVRSNQVEIARVPLAVKDENGWRCTSTFHIPGAPLHYAHDHIGNRVPTHVTVVTKKMLNGQVGTTAQEVVMRGGLSIHGARHWSQFLTMDGGRATKGNVERAHAVAIARIKEVRPDLFAVVFSDEEEDAQGEEVVNAASV